MGVGVLLVSVSSGAHPGGRGLPDWLGLEPWPSLDVTRPRPSLPPCPPESPWLLQGNAAPPLGPKLLPSTY